MVLSALLPQNGPWPMENDEWKNSDIDIFLYNIDEEGANRKINYIYNYLTSKIFTPITCVCTKNALSLVACFPQRTIQSVLSIFNTPQDVLFNFDLDCVCVLYDGSNIQALSRAFRAWSTSYNFVEIHKYKFNNRANESRIIKYQKRGFGAVLMNRENLVINKEKSNQHTPKSLAKTLFLRYKLEQDHLLAFNKFEIENANDALYTTAYIPYGPKITFSKLNIVLTNRSKADREKFFEKNPQAKPGDYSPFFLFGSSPFIVMQGEWKPHKIQLSNILPQE